MTFAVKELRVEYNNQKWNFSVPRCTFDFKEYAFLAIWRHIWYNLYRKSGYSEIEQRNLRAAENTVSAVRHCWQRVETRNIISTHQRVSHSTSTPKSAKGAKMRSAMFLLRIAFEVYFSFWRKFKAFQFHNLSIVVKAYLR